MAYPCYPFQDSMSSGLLSSTSMDINSGLIDPELGDLSSSPYRSGPWSPHQMPPRSLLDYSESPYANHSHLDSVFISNGIRQPHGTAPLPSAYLPRQGPPSDHPSSICSALSPCGGSEYSPEYSPPTPRDDMMSPYTTQYDVWGPQAQQLTGLINDCVKPGDISFSQEHILGYGQDSSPEFPLRGFSMSSNGSGCEFDRNTRTESIQIRRQMSPIEMLSDIKDEIHIPDTVKSESYPPLESEDDASVFDEIEVAGIPDEDSDEEYKPKRVPKLANSTANRNSGNRKRASTSQTSSQPKKPKLEPVSPAERRTSTKSSMVVPTASYRCQECRDIVFKDESGLQKHIKQTHTRPFTCIFNFAGCDSTFASKNEWKRHVASQHLLLKFWLCQQDSCAKLCNGASTATKATGTTRGRPQSQPRSQDGPALPNGAIFNRKDLYTQHLRRMHTPPTIKKQAKQKKPFPEWEERIRNYQEEAHTPRCALPDYMECPAAGCSMQFHGKNAWDEHMEHVAKHLEKAANGSESPVVFGGENDPTLLNWAARPDVAVVRSDGKGNWRLHNPLKPEKNTKPQTTLYGDEDAEGEDVDE